jgi:hypothetical protein
VWARERLGAGLIKVIQMMEDWDEALERSRMFLYFALHIPFQTLKFCSF